VLLEQTVDRLSIDPAFRGGVTDMAAVLLGQLHQEVALEGLDHGLFSRFLVAPSIRKTALAPNRIRLGRCSGNSVGPSATATPMLGPINCLECHASGDRTGCHGVPSWTIALSTVRSLRIAATSATFGALPAALTPAQGIETVE
jgi:hypothetical protein